MYIRYICGIIQEDLQKTLNKKTVIGGAGLK